MPNPPVTRYDLPALARQEMIEHGFAPDFSPEVARQVAALRAHASPPDSSGTMRDLRGLLWSSIDNDTSRDLDQIEVAERLANGNIRIRIGIADVDTDVPKGSPIDAHAAANCTTVYTGVKNFPMLPDALSTDLTSLNEHADRLSVVVELTVAADGSVQDGTAYRAIARNAAQLAYSSVGPWLEGKADPPAKLAASEDLQAQLRLQDEAAQKLRAQRHRLGALDLDRSETEPILSDGRVTGIKPRFRNRASELIEDFMVAANGVIARMLRDHHIASLRRVVKIPERWDRIVELAARTGDILPGDPDSGALNIYLTKRRNEDPVHYSDLSLAVVKLMGPGEYVLERPGEAAVGHFSVAVHDYTHSTAPNRRFADLVSQRLAKSGARQATFALRGRRVGWRGPQLHVAGGRRAQGREGYEQADRGRRPAQPHWRGLSGGGHRGYAERHVRASLVAARRRTADARRTWVGRGRPDPRKAVEYRPARGFTDFGRS